MKNEAYILTLHTDTNNILYGFCTVCVENVMMFIFMKQKRSEKNMRIIICSIPFDSKYTKRIIYIYMHNHTK